MGPLAGVKVIELAGLAPAPFGCMLLADLGAEVVRIERVVRGDGDVRPAPPGPTDALGRGRRSIAVDLKHPLVTPAVLRLVEQADVFIEPFRPGVTERLGLGPEECLARNPRLIYGRMTGWGQDGPLARAAGHDINYIALAGALEPFGRAGQPPVPPANLLGDFAGGGMLLALGVLAALYERERSGEGQVIDAAMVDGAALLTTFLHGLRHAGAWSDARGTNLLDTGAPFYDVYETADGRYVSVGAVEPQFFAELLERLGLADEPLPHQNDGRGWPQLEQRLAEVFRTRTLAEWCRLLEGTDACFAPVLGLGEAPGHPQNVARKTFVEIGGAIQPAPAPRFSRTPAGVPAPPPPPGADTTAVLLDWGLSAATVVELCDAGAIPPSSATNAVSLASTLRSASPPRSLCSSDGSNSTDRNWSRHA